eukprot:gnl/Chilomastix_cuspidata/1044.p1 GENE.gnl/Chilomastix_cuspidata/1044~~gnl/Chilomastix_cuspidata/1044.p1  ORF type:complete len:335 (-),score=173.45 gnl/Chilomastix_cuspidata/1044:104-1108(-)
MSDRAECTELRKELLALRKKRRNLEMACKAKTSRIEALQKKKPATGPGVRTPPRPSTKRINSVVTRQNSTIRDLQKQFERAQKRIVSMEAELKRLTAPDVADSLMQEIDAHEARIKESEKEIKALRAEIRRAEKQTEKFDKCDPDELTRAITGLRKELHSARYNEQLLKSQTRAVRARNEYLGALVAELMRANRDFLTRYLPSMSLDTALEFRREIEELATIDPPAPGAGADREELRDEFLALVQATLRQLRTAEARHKQTVRHHAELVRLFNALVQAVSDLDAAQTAKHGEGWAELATFRASAAKIDPAQNSVRLFAEEFERTQGAAAREELA